MSDNTNTNTNTNSQKNDGSVGFDESYVKDLRSENAKWRTKSKSIENELNDLKTKVDVLDIKEQLIERGIKVNPRWVERQEGETPQESVDRFLEEYPDIVNNSSNSVVPPTRGVGQPTPRVKKPVTDTTVPMDRSLSEIKNDPVARSKVRDHYRSLLSTSGRNTI